MQQQKETSPFFGVFLIELNEETARSIVIRVMKGKFQQGAEVVCERTTRSDAFLLPFFIRSALACVQVHASLTALHPDRPTERSLPLPSGVYSTTRFKLCVRLSISLTRQVLKDYSTD